MENLLENETSRKNFLNVDWKELGTKALTSLKNLGKLAIILVAICVGFYASEIWHYVQQNSKASAMQNTRKAHETSVALNERGELMVINRKDGSYQLFQDTVGKMIFDLYASKIYSDIKQK